MLKPSLTPDNPRQLKEARVCKHMLLVIIYSVFPPKRQTDSVGEVKKYL